MILERQTDVVDKIKISDSFGRTFKTLRVSLINTCNLACTYCVSPSTTSIKTESTIEKKTTLSNEQYIAIIRALNSLLEFNTIRLTGGEPLLYKQLVPLVKGIRDLGIPTIKMTSNGTLLDGKAHDLKNAGITSFNISLDAIDPDISYKINQRKNLLKILSGIDNAIAVGIGVKINCVVMKGYNDKHIIDILEYCKHRNISIRFLELMEMGHLHQNFEELFFSEKDILNCISSYYQLTAIKRKANATAKYWKTKDEYEFGIISNVSNPFCNDCNRLRLDSYGNIYGCLSDNSPISIIDCIDDEQQLLDKLMEALSQKKQKFSGSKLSMMHIGG
jgi:cyclic pyranopterin phosphate synthase